MQLARAAYRFKVGVSSARSNGDAPEQRATAVVVAQNGRIAVQQLLLGGAQGARQRASWTAAAEAADCTHLAAVQVTHVCGRVQRRAAAVVLVVGHGRRVLGSEQAVEHVGLVVERRQVRGRQVQRVDRQRVGVELQQHLERHDRAPDRCLERVSQQSAAEREASEREAAPSGTR